MTGALRAYVVSPSGTHTDAYVHQVDVDQHAVRFTPSENGPHLVHVLMDERPIPGSPFRVVVGQDDQGLVTASGEGLTHGRVGKSKLFDSCWLRWSFCISATCKWPYFMFIVEKIITWYTRWIGIAQETFSAQVDFNVELFITICIPCSNQDGNMSP